MRRSRILILIVILQGLTSLLSLIVGACLLVLMTGQVQIFHHDLTSLTVALKGLVAIDFAISLWGLLATAGLWRQQRWGWWGSLLFQVLGIVHQGLNGIASGAISRGADGAVLLSLGLIGGLCLPPVRQQIGSVGESDVAIP